MAETPNEHTNPVYDPIAERDAATNGQIVADILNEIVGADAWRPPEPPREQIVSGNGFDGYGRERHIAVCKMVSLGLTLEHAAQSIGISRSTLSKWRKLHPNLDRDIKQAEWIAVGAVAMILRQLMTNSDPKVQLAAVKFFLTTRAPEFREKVEVAADLNFAEIAKKVSADIYGQHGAARSQSLIAEEEAEKALPTPAGSEADCG